MSLNILYINYIDEEYQSSGSTVRPYMMHKAFVESGYHVLLLSGSTNTPDKKRERNKRISEVRKEVLLHKPDLCYIESTSSCLILLHEDRKLIKKIISMGVPTAYFYRDFYWRFPGDSDKRRRKFGHIKDLALKIYRRITDNVIKECDIVYFPSKECSELFSYKDMRVLPPAGNNHLDYQKKPFTHTCIYVGGIVGHYNGELLLDTFNELVNRDNSYRLIVVCRKNEWDSFEHQYKNARWLEVHHVTGDDLEPLYRRSLIALIAHQKNSYNKYAIPVKTFEYLSYGLPIVSVDVSALSSFINQEKIGITVKSDPISFANGIQQIIADETTYQGYVNNVRDSLLNRNLWKHRVESIVSDLFDYS